jgi:hypothetical protein
MLAAPVDSKNVNENGVVGDWEIVKETTSKGDGWIRQRAQPLLTEKLLMKTEPLPSPKLSTKPIPKLTRGFVTTNNTC